MATTPSMDDPLCERDAAELLRRHNTGEPEANITSALRDFLVTTGLAEREEIREEVAPAPGSALAVDLVAGDAFIEVKRRIGGAGGGLNPAAEYVRQIDDYLLAAHNAGSTGRMGVLTDGKHWVLRWKGARQLSLAYPYAFTLEAPDRWDALYEWLRDNALITYEGEYPDRDRIRRHFGPDSAAYEREMTGLRLIGDTVRPSPSFLTKRRLWETLLKTALGELAQTDEELDDLFIRHTYLSIVVALIVQARFGIDIRAVGETEPADLLTGRRLRNETGIQGIIESDFFAWPVEPGNDQSVITDIARRIARFDWSQAPADIAALLYESVIPRDERRRLGEYYTPHWLAQAIVHETVDNPLEQHVLDPSCGSGTFLAEAIAHFLSAAERTDMPAKEKLDRLIESVTGVDIHPVAVHLARAAWVIAASPAIRAVVDMGDRAPIAVPVYLGDSLLLRVNARGMLGESEVSIPLDDAEPDGNGDAPHSLVESTLTFPRSLVNRPADFDRLMTEAARAIEAGHDSLPLLDGTRRRGRTLTLTRLPTRQSNVNTSSTFTSARPSPPMSSSLRSRRSSP